MKSLIGVLQHIDSGRCSASFSLDRATGIFYKIVNRCRPELFTGARDAASYYDSDSDERCDEDSNNDSDAESDLDYACNLCSYQFSNLSQ